MSISQITSLTLYNFAQSGTTDTFASFSMKKVEYHYIGYRSNSC